MAPHITEDEVDDLIYCARAGESEELATALAELSKRENISTATLLSLARDEGKSTCLHMAAGNGHLEVVKALLQPYADEPIPEKKQFLDAPNEFGNTGLHWAAMNGHLEVVKVLVEAGASPALANDKNYVPLDLARWNEKIDVAEYFLSKTEGMEAQNEEGLEKAAEGVELEGDDVEAAERTET